MSVYMHFYNFAGHSKVVKFLLSVGADSQVRIECSTGICMIMCTGIFFNEIIVLMLEPATLHRKLMSMSVQLERGWSRLWRKPRDCFNSWRARYATSLSQTLLTTPWNQLACSGRYEFWVSLWHWSQIELTNAHWS